jgi:hypothetical protein
VVSSLWSEERFMGPRSVLRDDFRVDVRCTGPLDLDHDTRWMDVAFDPRSGAFQDNRLKTWEDRNRRKRHHKCKVRIVLSRRGDSLSRFQRLCCLECGNPLAISFYPEGKGWWADCSRSRRHWTEFGTMTDRLIGQGWWKDFVADRTCPRCDSDKHVTGIKLGLPYACTSEVWTGTGDLISEEMAQLRWHCRSCGLKFR